MGRIPAPTVRDDILNLAQVFGRRRADAAPALRRWYEQAGREQYLWEAEYRFAYLAEAVAFEVPALFFEYVAWAKILWLARGVEEDDFRKSLELMRDMLGEELPPDTRAVVLPAVAAAIARLPQFPTEVPSALPPDAPFAGLAREYLEAVLNGRGLAAQNAVFGAARAGADVRVLYRDVLQPCLYEVGRLWQLHQVNEAQEHFCAQVTERLMSTLSSLFRAPRRHRTFLGLCVAGEPHELGLRIVADFFEMDGWNTVFLGADTPSHALPQIINRWEPDVVGVSVTLAFNLPELQKLIEIMDTSGLARPPKLLIGGRPFSLCPELGTRFHSQGCAPDAEQAIALADELERAA